MGVQSGRAGGVGNGRRPLNPRDCKKVTRLMVLKAAAEISIKVKREGQGMWFRYHPIEEQWYTLGQTNFLAWSMLTQEKLPQHWYMKPNN